MEPEKDQSTKCIVILTTCSDYESAQRIATRLIEENLAACVQIDQPIVSVYRWENKVETAQEYRLVVKTSANCESLVFEMIQALHSYDVPQLVSIPITNGSNAYLDWILEETKRNQ